MEIEPKKLVASPVKQFNRLDFWGRNDRFCTHAKRAFFFKPVKVVF